MSSNVRCPNPEYAEKMIAAINAVRVRGDSIGGVVTCVVRNVPWVTSFIPLSTTHVHVLHNLVRYFLVLIWSLILEFLPETSYCMHACLLRGMDLWPSTKLQQSWLKRLYLYLQQRVSSLAVDSQVPFTRVTFT